MFVYYKPVELEDHFLFLSEICELIGLYTTAGNLHTKLLKAWFDTNPCEELYYNTKKGLTRVYDPNYFVPMCESLLSNIKDNKITINNKTYKVVIKNKT